MPTYEAVQRFWDDWNKLSADEQSEFRSAVTDFVADLERKGPFRNGLRVKPVEGAKGIFEMTWHFGKGKAGRATWQYGEEKKPGEPHVVWRRIGGHSIFGEP